MLKNGLGLAAAVVTAAIGLTACGGGGGSSKTAEKSVAGVRATVQEYIADLRDGKYDEACGLMNDAGRAEVGGGKADQCDDRLKLVVGLLPKAAFTNFAAQARAAPITVKGDTATLPQFSGRGTSTLKYEGGHWRIGPRAR